MKSGDYYDVSTQDKMIPKKRNFIKVFNMNLCVKFDFNESFIEDALIWGEKIVLDFGGILL